MKKASFGKYELTELLGSGDTGDVYEAHDTEKDRTVAVKILPEQYTHDESFRDRFLTTARAAANVQEPHIVPIHDYGELDGHLYIDMRLVRGRTLQDLIDAGPLEPYRAVAIGEQIAAALDAAHAEGLVHLDIKPRNVIVTPTDFAYLLDVGIASAQDDTEPVTGIYSLACLLHQVLTVESPSSDDNGDQSATAHPSAALHDVIVRGMAQEPDNRYGSACDFARAAQRALHDADSTPPVVTTPADAQLTTSAVSTRPSPVRLSVVGAAAAVLLGVVGLVAGLTMSKHSAPSDDSPPAATAAPVPPSTVYKTVSAPPTTTTTTTTSSATNDPEVTSAAQLRQIARDDFNLVSAQGSDVWVSQLSSKRPGVVDEGTVWDDSLTLAEHKKLRNRYGAKLLWSGDWSTFDSPDFWVTIAPTTYRTASGALQWCTYQGLDRNHCYAKLLSQTQGSSGSTAFN